MSDYKLVPLEPTDEMLNRVCPVAYSLETRGPQQDAEKVKIAQDHHAPQREAMRSIYKAILAAAPDHIPDAGKKVARPQIREAFLRNGARIEPDRDDLPDYVYESVFELLEMAAPCASDQCKTERQASLAAQNESQTAPAVQGEPVAFCEDAALSIAERTFSTDVDEQLASDIIQYAQRLHSLYAAPQPAEQQIAPHLDDAAVDRFAVAMKDKLAASREKGRHGWQNATAPYLSALLYDHMYKADPLDVGNLAMMLHQNGQAIELPHEVRKTAAQPAPDVAGLERALKSMVSGYMRLLQSGYDRITDLGGDCDPVDVMERDDAYLREARATLAAHRKQGSEAPVSPAARFPDCEMECGAYGSYCRCADESKEPSHDNQ